MVKVESIRTNLKTMAKKGKINLAPDRAKLEELVEEQKAELKKKEEKKSKKDKEEKTKESAPVF